MEEDSYFILYLLLNVLYLQNDLMYINNLVTLCVYLSSHTLFIRSTDTFQTEKNLKPRMHYPLKLGIENIASKIHSISKLKPPPTYRLTFSNEHAKLKNKRRKQQILEQNRQFFAEGFGFWKVYSKLNVFEIMDILRTIMI